MLPRSLLLAIFATALGSFAQDINATYSSSTQTSVNFVIANAPNDTSLAASVNFTDGYIFTCPRGVATGSTSGPTVYDTKGNVVWLGREYGLNECMDLKIENFEGQRVLTVWTGAFQAAGWGQGRVSILNENYQVIKTIENVDLHEANILDSNNNNTAVATVYQAVTADLSSVGGPSPGWILDCLAQEIDVNSGNVLFNWSALQHLPLNGSHAGVGGFGDSPDTAWDAFHLNSIDKDANGDYLLSIRHFHQLLHVNGSTGNITWKLGGNSTDFDKNGNTDTFYQHDARWQNGMTQISVFDNGASNWESDEPQARGLILGVNLTASPMTVDVVQEFLPSAAGLGFEGNGNYSQSQGSVQILETGNVLVGFGSNPWVAEYTPNGTAVYAAYLGFNQSDADNSGLQNYRAYKTPNWFGKPQFPPSMNVKNQTDGNITISTSWNGATQVSHYTFLTGSSTSNFNASQNYTRSSFETQWNVSSAGLQQLVQAVAYDFNGAELGRTNALNVVDGSVAANGTVVNPNPSPSATPTPSGSSRALTLGRGILFVSSLTLTIALML